MKKQPVWGYQVAHLSREVNRRVTYALSNLEYVASMEFPDSANCLNIIEK